MLGVPPEDIKDLSSQEAPQPASAAQSEPKELVEARFVFEVSQPILRLWAHLIECVGSVQLGWRLGGVPGWTDTGRLAGVGQWSIEREPMVASIRGCLWSTRCLRR